ncbi:MAG: hypothetical protein O3A20_00240 [Planctomycetota bacterium]|nr:hypothetical protein [Planctomycetota bacterium]
MILPALLSIAALAQQPVTSTRLEVRPEGAFWVETASTLQPWGFGSSAAPQTTARWEENHNGRAWIGKSVSVGDNGAVVMAGKELNNEDASVYAAGSEVPLFRVDLLGAERVRVATSARTPLAATLVYTAIASGNYEAVASAYDTTGSGTALWSYSFPAGGNVIAGDVMISADGQRVVAITGSSLTALNMVRVFNAAGALLNSFDLPAPAYVRQARLSADGSRLYFALYNGLAEIWNTATGANVMSFGIGSTFDAHALSADGSTFAYGDFGGLHVRRETLPGVWNQIAFMPVSAGGQYLGYVDLDADGSHAAWMQQRYSPAYDHIEIGLFDVAVNSGVWSNSHDAPGTAFQLTCSGVQISADGAQVVGCSWGDSLNVTPEVFGYDASGALSLSLDTPGSVFALDLDADGDVVAVGTKSVHANTSGNGGSIFCAEPYQPTLRVLGQPHIGTALTLTTPAGANVLRFAVCTQLGSSASPFGPTEVLLPSAIHTFGPIAIPGGGLSMPLGIPPNPNLAGMAIHLQGVRFGPGGALTNKVSLRLLP